MGVIIEFSAHRQKAKRGKEKTEQTPRASKSSNAFFVLPFPIRYLLFHGRQDPPRGRKRKPSVVLDGPQSAVMIPTTTLEPEERNETETLSLAPRAMLKHTHTHTYKR